LALRTVLDAALAAVHGRHCVRDYLLAHPLAGRVRLLAIGKASCAMVQGALEVLGDHIAAGLVITKHGHGEPGPFPCLEAGHPVPDAASLVAGDALADFVASAPPAEPWLVLISGGASALVEALPEGVTLEDLARVNEWLLGSGLGIYELNRVRKSLSRLKGGRLGWQLRGRPVLGLVISDVIGDDLSIVGSGLLVADGPSLSTPALPPWIERLLQLAPARPRSEDLAHVRVDVVANLDLARTAAGAAARRLGCHLMEHAAPLAKGATATGRRLAATLLEAPAGLHIWAGETTVRLPPQPGRGGRCQQLALAAATVLAGHRGAYLLAAGTDGTDGPGTQAGALVDADTVARGLAAGLDAEQALLRADAGSYLAATEDLLYTGPTGTNVMDLVLGLKLDCASLQGRG